MPEDRLKATIVVKKELWKELKKSSVDDEVTISELIEKLVDEHLKGRKRK